MTHQSRPSLLRGPHNKLLAPERVLGAGGLGGQWDGPGECAPRRLLPRHLLERISFIHRSETCPLNACSVPALCRLLGKQGQIQHRAGPRVQKQSGKDDFTGKEKTTEPRGAALTLMP